MFRNHLLLNFHSATTNGGTSSSLPTGSGYSITIYIPPYGKRCKELKLHRYRLIKLVSIICPPSDDNQLRWATYNMYIVFRPLFYGSCVSFLPTGRFQSTTTPRIAPKKSL